MRWQDAALILSIILVSMGTVTYTDVFSVLFNLNGVTYTDSGDSMVENDIGTAYINVTTTYWRMCFAHYNDTKYENETLFKKVSRGRTLHINLDHVDNVISTEPRIEVDWLVPARGRGNWRDVKDGDCWDRGKTNRIKLVGYNITKTVKWSFVTGEYVDIDPYWVVPTYGNVHFSMENFTVDGATLTGNWDSVDGTPTNFNIKNGEWVRPSCPT